MSSMSAILFLQKGAVKVGGPKPRTGDL